MSKYDCPGYKIDCHHCDWKSSCFSCITNNKFKTYKKGKSHGSNNNKSSSIGNKKKSN